jgi:hypothetical protein
MMATYSSSDSTFEDELSRLVAGMHLVANLSARVR